MVQCNQMNAIISERACRANKEMCKVATIQILEGLSPFSLKHEELDRLMWCSKCDSYLRWDDVRYTANRKAYNSDAIDPGPEEDGGLDIACAADVVALVLTSLRTNFLRIEHMDMDRGDREIAAKRRRKRERKYRENKRAEEARDSWVIDTTEEEI